MAGELDDLTVVVTGASSGIGWATALAFAGRGANVVLAARRAEPLNELAGRCVARGGGALAVPTDVTDAAQVKALADAAIGRFGGIDIWVNNAGVGVVGPFEEAPLEEHVEVIRVNLLGVIHGAHAAVPQLLAQGGCGMIINVGSLGSYFPTPLAASYGASKFGLAGFTDSLRAELAARSRIEVCGVYPSFVDTPAHQHAGNYTGRALNRRIPPLDPEDVAERIVDLWFHPRRAVTIGAPPGTRIAAALVPDAALRLFGRLARRALMERGRPAPGTGGTLLRPGPEGTDMRGYWQRAGAGPMRDAVVLAGLAAGALALLVARRRRRG